jgi:hypothetical protein
LYPTDREILMLDTVLVAAGVGFFIFGVLYSVACDRL